MGPKTTARDVDKMRYVATLLQAHRLTAILDDFEEMLRLLRRIKGRAPMKLTRDMHVEICEWLDELPDQLVLAHLDPAPRETEPTP